MGYLQNVKFPGKWLTVAYQIPEIKGILLCQVSVEKKIQKLTKEPFVSAYSQLRNLKFPLVITGQLPLVQERNGCIPFHNTKRIIIFNQLNSCIIVLFPPKIYLFIWERDCTYLHRWAWEQRGWAGREGEGQKQTPHWARSPRPWGHPSQDHEIKTEVEIKSWTPKWLSRPGAPIIHFKESKTNSQHSIF